MTHHEHDIFGNPVAPTIEVSDRDSPGWNNYGPSIQTDQCIRYQATTKHHPELVEVLKNYRESQDGSLNIYLRVINWPVKLEWNDDPTVYYLKMDPEYLGKLIEILDEEQKSGEIHEHGFKYEIITEKDLTPETEIWDTSCFLNNFVHMYFGIAFMNFSSEKCLIKGSMKNLIETK